MHRLATSWTWRWVAIAAWLLACAACRPSEADHQAASVVSGHVHGSNEMADAAELAVQSVVNISTTRIQRRVPTQEERLFRRFWGLRGGDHDETQSHSLGSGVIVDDKGIVVTSNHVIDGAQFIHVRLADGRDLTAELVGGDARSDLAVLRLQGDLKGLHALKFADSDKLRLGEVVLAIGSPYGLGQSVSHGIVSAKGRANVHIADYEDFVQTDAAINPGNSGGALVNLRGELVGIATAIASASGGSVGIGFAIPANMVRPLMQNLLEKGRVVRGWLGVGVQDLSAELREAFAVGDRAGVLITDVQRASPADRAGLRRGDVLLRLGPSATGSPLLMRNAIALAAVGSTLLVEVLRDGQVVQLQAVVAEAPEPSRAPLLATPASLPAAGLLVEPISPALRRERDLPANLNGLVITEVEADSAAARAGLQRGDLILEVDRKPVTTPTDLAQTMQAGKLAMLLVWRDGNASFVPLRP